MVKSTGNIPPQRFATAARRRDRQLAVVIAVVAVGVLARDIPWDLLPGDSGEFQFAAWRLGLAHPTGYPLYLLLGGGWQQLLSLFGMAPSGALNLLSALFAGTAAGLFYWLLVQWLPGPASTRRLGAGLAVAFLVANPTVRSQAIIAEVYALHLLLLVAILLAAHSLLMAGHAGEAEVVRPPRRFPRHLVMLCLLVGLALTHHATTLLLLPPLLLYLWLSDRTWWRPPRAWLWAAPALVLPSLLYLYIPLRSGPDASPWLHQRLGDGVLSLYANTLPAFVDFVTGRSISVGFYAGAEAWARAPIALLLWLRHFEWAGLVLMGVGIFVLVRQRQWPLLALTVGVVGVQQLFNLFYAIGDIFVYYIPCYVMGCIWIGFAAAGIGVGFRRELLQPDAALPPGSPIAPALRWARVLVVLLYWLPVQLWLQYTPLIQQARTESAAVRGAWETILAAQPPPEAILISNDRNEIVPLFYLQQVEGRAQGYTGLFPRMAPDARFADIVSTIATALASGAGQPVLLIKSMPGLETRFELAPLTPPLVEVRGPAVTRAPAAVVDQRYGPLLLRGYDWTPTPAGVQIDLHWQVIEPLLGDYTTTVQLFDEQGAKVGQDDRRPGGDYYPTSLWKPGEELLDRHTVALAPGIRPVRLLVGMYAGPEMTLLAPPLELMR